MKTSFPLIHKAFLWPKKHKTKLSYCEKSFSGNLYLIVFYYYYYDYLDNLILQKNAEKSMRKIEKKEPYS